MNCRIRLKQAIIGMQNSSDFSFPIIHQRSQERKLFLRKVQFIVRFGKTLDSWLMSQKIPIIDYCHELSDMSEELSGEWFAEKWNMWLKGKLESHIQDRF